MRTRRTHNADTVQDSSLTGATIVFTFDRTQPLGIGLRELSTLLARSGLQPPAQNKGFDLPAVLREKVAGEAQKRA